MQCIVLYIFNSGAPATEIQWADARFCLYFAPSHLLISDNFLASYDFCTSASARLYLAFFVLEARFRLMRF